MGFLNKSAVAWTTLVNNPTLNLDCTGATLAIVGVAWRNTNSTTITGVTCGGVAMTRIGSAFSSSSPVQTIDFWRLDNPTTGSQAIVATASNDIGTVGTGAVHCWAYNGVDLTSLIQTDTNTNAVTNFTTVGVNVTSTTGNFCLGIAAVASSSATGGGVTGGTEVLDDTITSTPNQLSTGSHAPGATSVAMGISYGPALTYNASGRWLSLVASAGGPTVLSPAKATLTLAGLLGSTNAFTSIIIREVLINEAGSPVGNRTGISLLIWYGGSPVGTPDLSYSALTSDANGTTSWSIATGSLAYNQPIFYVATDGGASLSAYTCARMVPTYS